MPEVFSNQVQETLEERAAQPALCYKDEWLTYGDVLRRAAAVGAALRALGLERGDRVALFSPHKLPYFHVHLGAILAGGVSLPTAFRAVPPHYYSWLDWQHHMTLVLLAHHSLVRLKLQHKCAGLQAHKKGHRRLHSNKPVSCWKPALRGTAGILACIVVAFWRETGRISKNEEPQNTEATRPSPQAHPARIPSGQRVGRGGPGVTTGPRRGCSRWRPSPRVCQT